MSPIRVYIALFVGAVVLGTVVFGVYKWRDMKLEIQTLSEDKRTLSRTVESQKLAIDAFVKNHEHTEKQLTELRKENTAAGSKIGSLQLQIRNLKSQQAQEWRNTPVQEDVKVLLREE